LNAKEGTWREEGRLLLAVRQRGVGLTGEENQANENKLLEKRKKSRLPEDKKREGEELLSGSLREGKGISVSRSVEEEEGGGS